MSAQLDAQVLTEGAQQVETFMAYRARNFNNDGGRELFVGVPDLGVGANRSERDFVWNNGGLTLFTVEYSNTLNSLYFSTTNTSNTNESLVPYGDWLNSTNQSENVNLDPDVLNYMTITVTVRDNDQSVLITDLHLNDIALQADDLSLIGAVDTDPSGAGTIASYSVSDFCFVNNDQDGFILAGNLSLSNDFSNSDERSKVEIQVGYDPRGRVCSDAIFIDGFEQTPSFPLQY